jgi:4-amino-4-deoxy-L-arabinose transferase-like glycosyltransferase
LPLLVALAPLWLAALFGRGLWTPDEPREADIAWRMTLQSEHALPQLAGTPFLEKPPLSYWLSAAALRAFGDSAGSARLPNLAYALVVALAVGALALAMGLEGGPALLSALFAASALLAYRVSVWLAPDAALLAGCALALLGMWLGYQAPRGWRKAGGYALMHLGAALGFMAKSAPGWLVPALAFLVLIVWERRWGELRRWELYAGLLLQALLIGPWLLAVAHGTDGAMALRTLFWHNIVGRFTQVAAPSALDYTSGHRNSPGKYLLELPLYLLPWTLVALAALVRAARSARADVAAATRWRFALGAAIPWLVLLSFAATARDVYAAPAVLGFALLAGLWLQAAQDSPTPLDRLCTAGTGVFVALFMLLALGALAVLGASGAAPHWAALLAAALILAMGGGALAYAARALRGADLWQGLAWCYSAYATTLVLSFLVIAPVIDRWQDLPGLARRVHADAAGGPLALLDPDETTLAVMDHGAPAPPTVLRSGAASVDETIAHWFASAGEESRVLVLLPGHAGGDVTRFLGRTGTSADGIAGELTSSGAAVLVQRYELPQGRRYALLGPPPAR